MNLINNIYLKLSIQQVEYQHQINADEFNASLKNGSSYLLSGSPYWTMTNSSTGKYKVGVYNLQSESDLINTKLDTRVTEYVKANIQVGGSGKYTDPWYFMTGYNVRITTNNSSYGKFISDSREVDTIDKIVEAGKEFQVEMKITPGYKYTGLDECNLKRRGQTNTYVIPKVTRDINCRAHFSERVYKFTLNSEKYTKEPVPKNIYYKYNDGWYRAYNESSNRVESRILKIEVPTRIGYNFKGYKYNGNTITYCGHTKDVCDRTLDYAVYYFYQ